MTDITESVQAKVEYCSKGILVYLYSNTPPPGNERRDDCLGFLDLHGFHPMHCKEGKVYAVDSNKGVTGTWFKITITKPVGAN